MDKNDIEKIFDKKFVGHLFEHLSGDEFLRVTDEVKDFFFDEILPEVLRDLEFTERDIQLVGEHYWDGDYSPTHRERDGVAQSMNYQFQKKAKEKYNINL